MKKFLSAAITLLLLLGTCGSMVFAAETDAAATVYVTISDANGQLVLTQEAITVTDADADGALTINDALYAAHEAKYEGGAAAGYGSGMTDYGLSLNKLWGTENGGSYGYYLNDASAWSLTDPVADGDAINAFVYTDLTAWSDQYCFFNVRNVEGTAGDTITLTLSAAGYDAEYNPITVPVENAVLTIDGVKTTYTTDANGSVSLSLGEADTYVLSAVSDTMTLVPPTCIVTVKAAPVVSETTAAETVTTAPQTSDSMAGWMTLAVSAAAVLTVVSVSRKKQNEK
ncbi:MAG: hypothetical protein ACI4V1_01670 [Eubacteriales bacterium]